MIFYLYGPDTYRSRQKLNAIKAKFTKELDQSGLNIQLLNGESLEAPDFATAISTAPFMAKKRLVIVEDLLSSASRPTLHQAILEQLQQAKLDSTIIVVWESTTPESTAKAKKNLHAFLHRQKYAQEFALLQPGQLHLWAEQEIKQRDGKIDTQALRLLCESVGSDLWRMNNEIDKLLAAANGQLIDSKLVSQLVATPIEDNIFALTDAIGSGATKQALKLISDQLTNGANHIELFGKIVWQFRNLLLVKNYLQQHGSRTPSQQLAQQLGIHPFVAKKTASLAIHHQLEQLKKTYRRLLEIDYQLKTSQTDPQVLFDLLVVQSKAAP